MRLLESDLDFVLVGGFASVLHGSTLVTQDLDICVLINEQQIQRLRLALKDLNPRHRMNPSVELSFLDESHDLSATSNIYLKTDWGVLDVMSEQPPVGSFKEIDSRAIRVDLFGHKCKVISIDDLIKIKESLKRPKDAATLAELLRIKALK